MDPQQIHELIAAQMPEARIEVSGGDGKYVAEVTSEAFDGLSTLKRHRLVYACVDAQIASGALHALTIVAKTPAEAG